MSSEITSATAIAEPGFRPECIISRQDLELLMRGAESERETGYRNLCTGIAASCGLGILSTVTSNFDQLVSAGTEPLESIFLILLSAVTLASGALAAFFHQRLRTAASRQAHQDLQRQIRERLEDNGAPQDPRYWP